MFDFVLSAIAQSAAVVSRLYAGLGVWPIITSVYLLWTVYRFIINPLFGGSTMSTPEYTVDTVDYSPDLWQRKGRLVYRRVGRWSWR